MGGGIDWLTPVCATSGAGGRICNPGLDQEQSLQPFGALVDALTIEHTDQGWNIYFRYEFAFPSKDLQSVWSDDM